MQIWADVILYGYTCKDESHVSICVDSFHNEHSCSRSCCLDVCPPSLLIYCLFLILHLLSTYIQSIRKHVKPHRKDLSQSYAVETHPCYDKGLGMLPLPMSSFVDDWPNVCPASSLFSLYTYQFILSMLSLRKIHFRKQAGFTL